MIASVYRLHHAVPRFPQTLQIQDNSAFRVCSGDQILPRAMRQTIASILAAAFVASANEARAVPSPNASIIQRSIILIEAWILKELSVVGLLLLLRLLIAAYYLLGTPAVRWSWIPPCWTMISAMMRLAASTPCNCVASRNPRTCRITTDIYPPLVEHSDQLCVKISPTTKYDDFKYQVSGFRFQNRCFVVSTSLK